MKAWHFLVNNFFFPSILSFVFSCEAILKRKHHNVFSVRSISTCTSTSTHCQFVVTKYFRGRRYRFLHSCGVYFYDTQLWVLYFEKEFLLIHYLNVHNYYLGYMNVTIASICIFRVNDIVVHFGYSQNWELKYIKAN